MKEDVLTLSASQFKAHCLQFLRALETRKHTRIIVTRRGKPIAELTHPQTQMPQLHGALRGSVRIAKGVDLTAPVMAEPLDAEQGIVHR